jgi:hypothetical protein
MIGLIIGVLWFVFASVIGGVAPEPTILSISNFLFYWYVGWWALFQFGVFTIGLLAMIFGQVEVKLVSPLVMFILFVLKSILSCMYATAAYLVYHAGDAAEALPLAEWDRGSLISAGVLVVLALLFSLFTRFQTNNNK